MGTQLGETKQQQHGQNYHLGMFCQIVLPLASITEWRYWQFAPPPPRCYRSTYRLVSVPASPRTTGIKRRTTTIWRMACLPDFQIYRHVCFSFDFFSASTFLSSSSVIFFAIVLQQLPTSQTYLASSDVS